MANKSALRRKKKEAARKQKAQEALTRKAHALRNKQVNRSQIKQCNELHVMCLNVIRSALAIANETDFVIKYWTAMTNDYPESIKDQFNERWKAFMLASAYLKDKTGQILIKCGQNEDNSFAFSRMVNTLELMPDVQLCYELQNEIRNRVSELIKEQTTYNDAFKAGNRDEYSVTAQVFDLKSYLDANAEYFSLQHALLDEFKSLPDTIDTMSSLAESLETVSTNLTEVASEQKEQSDIDTVEGANVCPAVEATNVELTPVESVTVDETTVTPTESTLVITCDNK